MVYSVTVLQTNGTLFSVRPDL